MDSDNLTNENHEKSLSKIISLLNEICGIKELSVAMIESIKKSSNKPLSRITYRSSNTRLSITVNRFLYICMYESAADLPMLNDFELFKDSLDIVRRSFVTLGKAITPN